MAEGYRDDSELADPAHLKATQVIKDLIEALPFPAIANDWQTEEIKCVAMNDHYVENQNCPRDFLLNKNNRVLDPTHLTSLPGSARVGIRSALAHGFPFDTNFETVMSASPDQKFIKRVSIRMVIVGGFRFILGWQHHLGKDMRYGLSNAEWWTMTALKLKEKAEAEGMESSWVSEESAAQWIAEPTGIFQQTDTLCRKEDLDAAIWKSLDQLSHPVLLCDPFLPECPVIGINKAAQELSGWSAAGSEVTAADAKLLAGAGPLQRGAHYLTYGRYAPGEEEERIAIRTACANGRPCAVGLRGMYSFQSSCSVWLQGVTVAQGVNKGPLGGGMQIWYLVGVLSKEPKEEWATAAPSSAALQAVKAAFQEIMASAEKGLACDTTPFAQTEAPATSAHPYGGDVRFLQETLWHMAKGSD